MRNVVRSALVVLLLGAPTAPLAAQDIGPMSSGPERSGFFFGLGFGGGSARLDCNICDNEPDNGGAGWLTVGGTISPKLRLAGDFNAWTKDENGTTASFGTGTFSALFYPSAAGNLFLKAGVGYSVTKFKDKSLGLDAQGGGFGGVLGAGYDLRVGRSISITPQLTFFGGSTGDVKDGSFTVLQDSKFNVAALSVGIVFH